MKLTRSDKQLLKEWGFLDEDMRQIEMAMNERITTYELNNNQISRDKVIEILGKEQYLSGISRSAFHWSAMRESIYFDSSKLFK